MYLIYLTMFLSDHLNPKQINIRPRIICWHITCGNIEASYKNKNLPKNPNIYAHLFLKTMNDNRLIFSLL